MVITRVAPIIWLLSFFMASQSVAELNRSIEAQSRFSARYAPITHTVRLGSHNSFDIPENYAPSRLGLPFDRIDQRKSISEQLDIGVRYIEYDISWALHHSNNRYHYVLCKKGSCAESGRTLLSDGLKELNNWLNGHSDEVVVLRMRDHSGNASKKLYDVFESAGIVGKIFPSGGCRSIPDGLSYADIRGAGKQLILWKDADEPGNDDCYEGTDQRFSHLAYTGSGNLSFKIEDLAFVALPDYVAFINSDAVSQYTSEEVNVIALKRVEPDDDRNSRILWSWDEGKPENKDHDKNCVMQQSSNGRWRNEDCQRPLFHACKNVKTSQWALGNSAASSWFDGVNACEKLGTDFQFSAPACPLDNAALHAATAGRDVWIAMNDLGKEDFWATPAFEYRSLQNVASNLCISISDDIFAETEPCTAESNKWLHSPSTGLIHAHGTDLCISADDCRSYGCQLTVDQCNNDDAFQKFLIRGRKFVLQVEKTQAMTADVRSGRVILLSDTAGENDQKWNWGEKAME